MGLQVGINRPVGCKTGIKKPTLCSAGCGDCRCRPHRALLLWRIHLTLRQVGMDSQTQLKMWGGLSAIELGVSSQNRQPETQKLLFQAAFLIRKRHFF